MTRSTLAFLIAVVSMGSIAPFATAQSVAQSNPNYASELPRIAPLDTLAAMAAIHVKDSFEIELAAAEPLVRDPVAMCFDGNGRLFVVEMCDYSEQDKEFLGNVRMLEDLDNDGRYEKSTLYAHHLSWPTGVFCYDGGLFVAAAPDIYYLKDTDGDGQADVRSTIFTGFGRHNVQGLLNSFCWGPDNRIYCQSSSCGGTITSPANPNLPAITLGGRDFSFDPRTFEIRLESGGGQHGMCFDDWGRRFVCHNSDHLQLFLYPDRYLSANDPVPLPPSRQSIAADGPQANVYRISPIEPWRLVRTRLRVSGQSPGLIEGGGRAAGYFTSATGITIYRGDAYPEVMSGMAFVGDVGSNIVHRKKLTEQGISMVGHRIDEESEFIAATDIWFRPVQFANAPDGTLYIADLYREVIEHPRSLPDEIKQHLDLTSGRDRGRIYRVVPPNFKRPTMPQLENASIDVLIKTLEHRNGWHRDTASRLLYERLVHQPNATLVNEAIPKLQNIATKSTLPQARMHALGLLASCGAGQGRGIAEALRDEHSKVREWAIQCIERVSDIDETMIESLYDLASTSDLRTRFQLALTLSKIPIDPAQRIRILTEALTTHPVQDAWVTAALMNAIGQDSYSFLQQYLISIKDESQKIAPDAIPNLRLLANLAAKNSERTQLRELDRILAVQGEPAQRYLALGMIEALQARFADKEARDSIFLDMPNVAKTRLALIDTARPRCADTHAEVDQRLEAITYLLWDASETDIPLLAGLISQREPSTIQEAATRALMRFPSMEVANQLMEKWPALSPRLRTLASDVIFSRPAWMEALLDRAGQGGIALSELEPTKLAALRNNPKLADRVNSLLKQSDRGTRQEILAQYRKASSMTGDKTRGKAAFAKSCAACHRLEGVGHELAPNLATFQFRGADAILQNIIEPNREVNPQYLNYSVLTKDDRIVTGMISNESAASVTLLKGENVSETVARTDIAEMKSSKLSLMPEGLESQLDLQSMADLLSYLTTLP